METPPIGLQPMKNARRNSLRRLLLAVALSAGLGFVTPASFAQEYHSYIVDLNSKTVKDLGTLGSKSIYATHINDTGQVVGTLDMYQSYSRAFITGPNGVGMTVVLGTPGGKYSEATGINASGQVVGDYFAGGKYHGFITGPNGVGMTALGTLGESYGRPSGINDAGQVVGTLDMYQSYSRAFITGPNGVGMTVLGTPGGKYSEATGINASGQVVGDYVAGGKYHGFITGPNGVGMTELLIGSIDTQPYAINASGQVVGVASLVAGDQPHTFITGPNGVGFTDLGTPPGEAYSGAGGVNDAGQVVGRMTHNPTPLGPSSPFITGPNGVGMTDLNSLVSLPGVTFTSAVDINNHGQVIVIGVVPEPETYALLLAGLGLIGAMTRRRKAV